MAINLLDSYIEKMEAIAGRARRKAGLKLRQSGLTVETRRNLGKAPMLSVT
jgi:hypothetical protein